MVNKSSWPSACSQVRGIPAPGGRWSARCGDGVRETLRVTWSHHHPRPTQGDRSHAISHNSLTLAALWTRLRESGPCKETNGSAKAWTTLAEPPLPRAGSVPSIGVTQTSETLVCNGDSSCSARDCGPLTQRGAEVPAAGSGARVAGAPGPASIPAGHRMASACATEQLLAQREARRRGRAFYGGVGSGPAGHSCPLRCLARPATLPQGSSKQE